MPTAKEVKNILTAKVPRVEPIPDNAWLSLGAVPLNLAVSGRANGGIAKGMYVWFVGDSSSGKTFFALGVMAEASINPNFKDYKFYYDNAENGNWFDVAKFFGPRLAGRIEVPPGIKNVVPGRSRKVEEFYYHLHAAVNQGPCIYVLDSMDCLEGTADEDKFLEVMGAIGTKKEGEVKGTMGMAVATANSRNIKRYQSSLADTGSILIVINQVRANIKTSPYQHGPATKPGQGGHALKFYASVELWTRIVGRMRKTVMGNEVEYGRWVSVDVKKNRVNGNESSVTLPFLRSHGIDKVGACVDFLLDWKWWKSPKAKKGEAKVAAIDTGEDRDKRPKVFVAPEFGNFQGDRERFVGLIEERRGEERLYALTERVWRMIDEQATVKRRNYYA